MKFLDSKEEVLKFELTPYGKKLLAEGNFKPEYYSFGDSNVLYDISSASGSEVQKDSGNRIYNETLTTAGSLALARTVEDKSHIIDTVENQRTTIRNLGTMESNEQLSPRWKVSFLKGIMDSVSILDVNRCEMTGTIRYKIVETQNSIPQNDSFSFSIGDTEQIHQIDDKNYVFVEDDYLIVEFEEENVKFTDENFIFKIKDIDSGEYLYFSEDAFEDSESSVENNFIILTDKQIPAEIICKYLKENNKKDFFDDKIFECKDRQKVDWKDMYDNLVDKFKGIC